jgi:hypothetical protein
MIILKIYQKQIYENLYQCHLEHLIMMKNIKINHQENVVVHLVENQQVENYHHHQ